MPTIPSITVRGARATFAAIAAIATLCGAASALSQTNISTPAYTLINARTAADQASFYVYLDQDSGFNHGFPSGFFASNPGNLSTVTLNSGCIDDSASSTGCNTDPSVLDQVHGTVLAINFAAQTTGNYAGLNIEEPQDWGALQYGNGYNLAGATSVSFNVRSPNGAQVQFSVGGCSAPYTAPITSTWTTITYSLSTSSLSCTPNLADVHLLFQVATNDAHDPTGATVLLDNIQFTPVPTAQKTALSFPLANQTFGVVPQSNPPIPSDQVLRNLTTIYESSLAEYVLLARGQTQDLANAQLIANTFDYALNHESHGDPIPAAPGGYLGLHNGYESGDIGLYNNQPPPLVGMAGDVRLAGFTDTTLCDPSGYCLVLDGATGGNNAFAIIALVDAYRQFGNIAYLNDARSIGNWIIANLTDTTGTGYGGYYVGYGDEGIPPPKPIETGKSIENNADIFGAFTALANEEAQLGNWMDSYSWTSAANVAGDFVMLMYDPVNNRFNVGTSPAGSQPAPGNCPTGPQRGNEVINVCDFLDSNTFTTLAMAAAPRYQNQINWRLPVQYALDTFDQSITAAGLTYQGFDIVPTPDSGPNGVAWEFTGQEVESLNYVDKLYNVTTYAASATTYLDQIAQAQTSAPFKDGNGLVASTLQNGNTLTPINQCLSTPYQCIAERVGLAATSWGILAEKQLNYYNPLQVGSVTTLASSLNPSKSGQSVTFTATVAWKLGGGSPTGNVTFKSGSTTLGSSALSSGVATLSSSTLAVGTSSITAVYGGDSNYAASTSSALSQVVDATQPAATPTFSVAAGTYAVAQTVYLSDSTSGAVIHFTTNGTTPTASSPVYSSAIVVSSTETIKALAVATGYANSGVASAAYTITPEVGNGYTMSVLHSFTGYPDGAYPVAGLLRDAAGNLYGTATQSGANYGGAVFKVTPAGVESVLYSFPGGSLAYSGLIEDASGNLYGSTEFSANSGPGTVYKVTPAGVGSILYTFTNGADGGYPESNLVLDGSGNLYGTTLMGGASGVGTVFEVSAAGHESVLYSFTGQTDGGSPVSAGGLLRDASGNLYGTASSGGAFYADGDVFKVTPGGAESVLYSFSGLPDGMTPFAGLIQDSAGNRYGTTSAGGAPQCNERGVAGYACGTVFKLSAAGDETVLYSFTGNPDGWYPYGGLVLDAAGNLYGTTLDGGLYGYGTVFRVSPAGAETVLWSFSGGADGGYPWGGLVIDASGNLYGTTRQGGSVGLGTVFKLVP